MNYPKFTAWLLVALMALLVPMVPGGPIETRSFATVNSFLVMGFNIFLTLLMITSITTTYFMFKKQKWAYQLVGILGLSFALVFILDLAEIFPVSPDPMETPLLVLEWISLLMGALLMFFSYKSLTVTGQSYWSGAFKLPRWLIISIALLLLLGIYVVYFATTSALS